ncbi:MAG: alpha-galactosidase [Caldilineaceae bacterium]
MSIQPGFSSAADVTSAELTQRDQWTITYLKPGRMALPFSFIYNGTSSHDFLDRWAVQHESQTLDASRTQQTITWRDGETGLAVRWVAVTYLDFPVVEWTLYFKNTGTASTPILENIQALDLKVEREKEGEFVLHHQRGDFCTADSYQPFQQLLWQNTTQTLAPVGGRSCNSAFPYFNVQMPGGGLILAIGWPGQWSATFQRDAQRGLRICAGQERTHLVLQPGEEIRTPLMALLFWAGADAPRAQNLWRRWLIAHNLPKTKGELPPLINSICIGPWPEAEQKANMDFFAAQETHIPYWWVDAGWYPCAGHWTNTGAWEPDPQQLPNGFKPVSDHAHQHGMELIVWFEPERVTPDTWLYDEHPEWLLSRPVDPSGKGWKLLNLGNPEAWRWLVEHIDGMITEQGIDLYRQDFNIDPLDFWRAADPPDRQGLTENRYVQGYLAYWDELRRRHPDMLIDSCASGGRRNDLETVRRSVPLLRSDYQSFQGDPSYALGNQCHTYTLSSWLPYHGQGVYYKEDHFVYSARSYMCPAFAIALATPKEEVNWSLYRRTLDDWRRIAPAYWGDYYPLTPYSLDDDQWMAWQFHRPEPGDGMIQAFRRFHNNEQSRVLHLRGLNPVALYIVADLDGKMATQATGAELMEQGLRVEITEKPGAMLITYTEG